MISSREWQNSEYYVGPSYAIRSIHIGSFPTLEYIAVIFAHNIGDKKTSIIQSEHWENLR